LSAAARIVEVGPRDGLQSYDGHVPTDRKVAMIERLVAAGLTDVEATSFAHPKMVPELADGAEVLAALPRLDGVRYRALVPNHRGAVRAVEAGADLVVAFISASPTYSERNQNMTIEGALGQLEAIAEVTRDAGTGWAAGISMAFGSPYEDAIEPDVVVGLARRCAELGAVSVYVADTIGVASPEAVRAMCAQVLPVVPELAVHLHGDGGPRGLSCAVAAVEAGATQVETSICGLGGPVVRSPGAPLIGNLPTEAVAAHFADHGISTGLDPAAVFEAAADVADLLGLPHD
jgi:hydroxymethylglutaryl-CoA lyase